MLARPTESVLVESENSSRGGAYDQQHKHPLQEPLNVNKMESLENTGLDTKEWEKDESDATTSKEETIAHVCRKRRRLFAKRTARMD